MARRAAQDAPLPNGTLFYGDNLAVLREHIKDASVDLIYLDPPFNSKRDYNVIYRERDGGEPEAQARAFEDSWTWDKTAEATLAELTNPKNKFPEKLVVLVESLLAFLDRTDTMAYLIMMAIRMVELRRVLKPTGSIYLHC